MTKAVNFEAEKNQLAALLLRTENKNAVAKIKEILMTSKEEGRLSINEYNTALEKAEERVKNGDFISHDTVKSRKRVWQRKS